MRTISAFDPLPDVLRRSCVALGNFDGLHAGHRAVIDSARAQADAASAPLAVATFEPAPRRYFQPDAPPFRLMTPRRRELTLESLGVDLCSLLPFDARLAAMTDREFISRILHDALGARSVSVGEDFRFGRGRMGDTDSLRRIGFELGVHVEIVGLIASDGEKVSSTRIRDMIAAGDVGQAGAALGGCWVVDAEVEAGERRGRTLGFPTANMKLGEIIHPAHGVYAVWARLEDDGVWRPGVASFGRTPTTGLRDALLEVNIFDFTGDLYGRRLHTAFAKFLRPEIAFDSLDALVARMHEDAAEARTVLQGLNPPRV